MEDNSYWKQFLIGVLGTAIGVGLTFFVSGIQERRAQAHAQRMTAIMVIHDIDNTIDLLKQIKSQEEDDNKFIQALLKRLDKLDIIPYDTLSRALNILRREDSDFHFDTSKEKIFNSDLDTWQNLGSMKFIDNVQTFFYHRQYLQTYINSDSFREPLSREEYMPVVRTGRWVTADEFAARVSPFMKEKLTDDVDVLYYINTFESRISYFTQCIDSWTSQNDENKFLMGITDRELEDYINSITDHGIALSPARLAGWWVYAREDDNAFEYDFHRDNSLDCIFHYTVSTHQPYWSGRLKFAVSVSGKWSLQADSLFLDMDYADADVQMDLSGLEAEEEHRDSLDAWVGRYRESLVKYYDNEAEENPRRAYKARMDSSHDKMEWIRQDGVTAYLKRKK